MKAIILAGGHATRLWPITKNRAKPLLPLGEKPIIDYIIEDINSEVDEIIISTNEKFGNDFKNYVEEYERDNTRVVIENQNSEEEKPGTIGAIITLIEEENLDDDLLIIGGDNYYSFEISEFLDFAKQKNAPANVVYDVRDLESAKQFGIVDVDHRSEKITDFLEKPEEPPSTLASTACYFFNKENISLFHEYEEHFKETDVPKEKYLDEPGRLIEWAHKKTDMYAYSFSGHWFDVGTIEGYLEAVSNITDQNIIEGETKGCEIGDNVVIMKDAVVERTSLENTIVFPNAEIKNSQLRNSLIDKNVEIRDTDLNDAIIGEHSSI